MEQNILTTDRLILRPWQEADAEALYRYAQDPTIGPIAGWPPHTSVEDSLQVIRTVFAAPETYAVVLKETGEPVGSAGIMLGDGTHSAEMQEGEGEIGYWIGVPYWGRGLIPEAVHRLLARCFDNLGLTAVWCGYYDGNTQSRRVMEKCGFRPHHTETGKTSPLEDVRTEHFMRLTREEWKAAGNHASSAENNPNTQPQETMDTRLITIRPATPDDAAIIAAALTMALGEASMKTYCGEHYQSVLEELARREDTQYSYRNALVAKVDGKAAGAIVGYDGARLNELRRPTLRLIEERTGRAFPHVEDETAPGEYYLDSVGVLPEYRNLGIGGRLLTALRDRAFALGHDRAGLLVDVENPNAERLYHSLGFKRVEARSFAGHRVWHMQATRG